SGTRLHTLTGHTDWVSEVATLQTPHGPLAVTGAADSSAIVWDLTRGDEVSRCHLPNGGSHVAVIEAGFIVAYEAEVAYYMWPRGNRTGHDNGRHGSTYGHDQIAAAP
ncbi:hypothetical protein ACFQ7N_01965, partial [Streptomyces niveus]|uniref:hypothetical protein n=1 Tax=Streptomyces niveus TaxID=193462 RepID=UPI00369DE028